ncbi:MAG TPA: DUF2779 domain-containing protein [Gemmatimonadales bacterium]|nr:DUF2779 domain-containing protein [Gemmatimonadales bacterium]
MPDAPARLSKSRFTSGLQCHKKLWWEVHDDDLPERDLATEFILNQGREIGELARRYAPGGVLIDLPHDQYLEKVRATEEALAGGATRIYEASFFAEGVFAAVDILEREGPRFTVVEVKSSTKVKDEHLADVAIQTWVARRAGVNVTRAEVMHLNSECTYPDLTNLFAREDVTPLVETYQLDVPAKLAAQFAMLAGELPDVPIGPHCSSPRECPFIERCWKHVPEHHITTLYGIGQKAWGLLADGCDTVLDLPPAFRLNEVRARQLRAVQHNDIVVEPRLGAALEALPRPIAHLDFETIGPAVPVWPGCHPYHGVAVQFSCHIENGAGEFEHREWLADGPDDPRPAIAAALVEACRGANAVLTYTGFERVQIRRLAAAVPALAAELQDLEGRLVDLAKIVREHVYHPAFGGSFSLKEVLPALVPELTYDDLAVNDGNVASALLNRMLLRGDPATPRERAALRANLLAYCKMDTWAMVKLVERLRELGGRG